MPHIDDAVRFIDLAQDDSYVCHTLSDDQNVSSRIVCFHAQQAIEKACKAVIILQGMVPGKTHDLTELAYIIQDVGIQFPTPIQRLAFLTPYAVTMQYGGEINGAMDPEEACSIMDTVLSFAKNMLKNADGSIE